MCQKIHSAPTMDVKFVFSCLKSGREIGIFFCSSEWLRHIKILTHILTQATNVESVDIEG